MTISKIVPAFPSKGTGAGVGDAVGVGDSVGVGDNVAVGVGVGGPLVKLKSSSTNTDAVQEITTLAIPEPLSARVCIDVLTDLDAVSNSPPLEL